MNFSQVNGWDLQKGWVNDATCVQTADMLNILGFLIRIFERYSFYFIFNELLLNFSRLIDLRLQKMWGDWMKT
jgi:hypothetical protein